jgi:carboxypeptidase family protein
VVLAIAFAACATSGCHDTPPPSAPTPTPTPPAAPARTIRGTVYETVPTDTTPIAGARVTVDDGPNAGKTAVADSSGRYAISGLLDSTFKLHASANGYIDRAGSLVLDQDRVLDFRLVPEPRTITDVVTGTIANCNGQVYIVCFSYRFYLHSPGPIVLEQVTFTGANESSMEVQVYYPAQDRVLVSPQGRSPGTLSVNVCSGCTGTYDFRIVGRVIGPVSLTARITHGN